MSATHCNQLCFRNSFNQKLIKFLKSDTGGAGGCSQARGYPDNKQCNGAWSGQGLGSSTTICASGCLVCSVASALAGLGKKINGAAPTCATLNNFLKSNGGYSGNLFVWGAVSSFGLVYEGQPTDKNAIKAAICANKIVILNVNAGGHWVLA